jgi:hypothetical protein
MARQKVKTEKGSMPILKPLVRDSKEFRIQVLILVIIGFIFYTNSFFNAYALDDGIVIQKNDYVQEGVRGIPKILSTDAYESFYRQMGAKQQLSGGRYRPLSVVTFAVEQQLFGSPEEAPPSDDVAFVRHFMNAVSYTHLTLPTSP